MFAVRVEVDVADAAAGRVALGLLARLAGAPGVEHLTLDGARPRAVAFVVSADPLAAERLVRDLATSVLAPAALVPRCAALLSIPLPTPG